MADWTALHRALWAAVRAHEARLGETTAEYTQAIIDALRDGGWVLTEAAQAHVTDYLDAVDGMLRDGIAKAVTPLADAAAAGGGALASETIAQAVDAAYQTAWPDGLRLSQRLWRWQEATRAGVSGALADGLRTQRSAGAILMDMQRAIEAQAGERFALAAALPADWADRLAEAGRVTIRTPGMARRWAQALAAAREHVDGLREGGTRRQAEHALAQIQDAIAKGRTDLLEERMRWWLYDRQQYALRRIVRTEMATAHHRTVISTTEGDPLVVGYRWRLSASHPEPDICDYYADVDFGLGAGVWPKDRVPHHKAHPHCMCSLTPTTRAMRSDGKRGAVDLTGFLAAANSATLERMVPDWARAARAAGTPWSALLRPDGAWLMSLEEARAAGVVGPSIT